MKLGPDRTKSLRFGTARVKIGEDETWDEIVSAANADIRRVKLKETVQEISPKGAFPETPLLFKVENN